MSYRVSASAGPCSGALTVTGVLQRLSAAGPPERMAFPQLGNPDGRTYEFGQREGHTVQLGAQAEVARSWGLDTCASVCFVTSASTTGYVFHAGSGSIPQAAFLEAMRQLGVGQAQYRTVCVAYAHRGASTREYQIEVEQLVNRGIPTDQIVEIANLYDSKFGMNNCLQIGY